MTALNCFVTPDAVHIATDGAMYLPDGRVVHEGQKVAILAHLPAVIGVRGPHMLIPSLVANASAAFTEFDALAAAAPALFRAVHEQYRAAMTARGMADATPHESEFVLAGWSTARGRVEACGIHSHDRNGFDPWTAFSIEGAMISPSDPELFDGLDALDLDEFLSDPAGATLRIMELQRARPFDLDGHATVAAGGFCQLTTLTREAISTRVVKRWTGEARP